MDTGVSEPARTCGRSPTVQADHGDSATTFGRGLVALATPVLDLVFPALCPVCRAPLGPGRRDPLCGACWDAIARIEPPYCASCGVPFLAFDSPALAAARCSPCVAAPAAYDYARSAALYGGPLREALHAFKFSGKRALARPLADLVLEQCAGALPDGIVAVVPVPLSPDRERERGFNQARLLAERVARRLGTRLEPRWLARVRPTRPQSDLSAAERALNVRDAFRASPAAARRHVLVVDDILTTGTTVEECARALRSAGASRIGVLTVARVLSAAV